MRLQSSSILINQKQQTALHARHKPRRWHAVSYCNFTWNINYYFKGNTEGDFEKDVLD